MASSWPGGFSLGQRINACRSCSVSSSSMAASARASTSVAAEKGNASLISISLWLAVERSGGRRGIMGAWTVAVSAGVLPAQIALEAREVGVGGEPPTPHARPVAAAASAADDEELL